MKIVKYTNLENVRQDQRTNKQLKVMPDEHKMVSQQLVNERMARLKMEKSMNEMKERYMSCSHT